MLPHVLESGVVRAGMLYAAYRFFRADLSPAIPVIVAAKNRCAKTVDLLVRMGANINGRDAYGNTALHYACENNDLFMMRQLILLGANPASPNKLLEFPLAKVSTDLRFEARIEMNLALEDRGLKLGIPLMNRPISRL